MISPQHSKGYAYTLSLLRWDIFATLTFKGKLPIERRAWRIAWRHLHQVADSLGVPYSMLLIALRSEHGELGDRLHFHYLLGRTGASNLHTLAFRSARLWSELSGGGHAEVRPYDRRLSGADYVEGCLSGGANSYEVGKFNQADRLELSASVHRAVFSALRDASQPGRECYEAAPVQAVKAMRENTRSPGLTGDREDRLAPAYVGCRPLASQV